MAQENRCRSSPSIWLHRHLETVAREHAVRLNATSTCGSASARRLSARRSVSDGTESIGRPITIAVPVCRTDLEHCTIFDATDKRRRPAPWRPARHRHPERNRDDLRTRQRVQGRGPIQNQESRHDRNVLRHLLRITPDEFEKCMEGFYMAESRRSLTPCSADILPTGFGRGRLYSKTLSRSPSKKMRSSTRRPASL